MAARAIVLLGAESTGKTTLAARLGEALAREGLSVAVVDEYLREFCDTRQRTPTPAEQAGIAREQMRRIAEARAGHDVVVADTHALMTAVYSDYLFADTSLYDDALAALQPDDIVLLTALDLPWTADEVRDGPHVRAPVDALIRAALARGDVAHAVAAGQGEARLATALATVRHALGRARDDAQDLAAYRRWQGRCERCSDGACERHLFSLPHDPAG
jgi:nicotinamide riboside kinase